MSVPKSVVRFSKNGVEYKSSVDRVSYTIRELSRAAMRDVGKFVVRTCNSEAMRRPSIRKQKNARFRVCGKSSAFQYWARKQECDLQVGIKHNTWYGVQQELGDRGQPKLGILRASVYDNIPTIVEIESQYLSALEDEAAALAIVEESENAEETEAVDE